MVRYEVLRSEGIFSNQVRMKYISSLDAPR